MISKRRDDKGRVLQQGEWQEPSGRYRYKYTSQPIPPLKPAKKSFFPSKPNNIPNPVVAINEATI